MAADYFLDSTIDLIETSIALSASAQKFSVKAKANKIEKPFPR